MLNLLKIEWLKIKKYPAFWWMLGIVALTYPGVNYMAYSFFKGLVNKKDMSGSIAQSLLGNPFAFPETWHSVAYFSSFFTMIPAILVIMIITNEYTFKTNRQNIIDGWSRNQFVTSKILDVAIISIVATLMYILTAAGYGFRLNSEAQGSWQEGITYIPLFLLQTFSQLSLAFLLGFVIKKSFIALGIFVFYFLILENMLLGILKWKNLSIGEFLPLEISDKLVPGPMFFSKFDEEGYSKAVTIINEHVIYTILFTTLIWFICYRIYAKRNL